MAKTNGSKVAHTHNGRFTNLDPDKLRGGYYTSQKVVDWLCTWAIRATTDRVLEPCCGDGGFLVGAAKRFGDLGASSPTITQNLTGIEIIADEAARARARLRKQFSLRTRNIVKTSDFFSWWQRPKRPSFNAVIGNPPFIRYQSFPEPHRSRAMQIMVGQGLTANRLTNIWVPFVVAATASLRPGGRLAFVLPAELLQVTYAAQLRSFLTARFSRIDIVTCNELFFEKAEQEVVLLLADSALPEVSESNLCRVTLTETHTVNEIVERRPKAVLARAQPKTIRHDQEKWLKYFLSKREIEFMRELRSSSISTVLATHASVNVGVVTGKNSFFVLNRKQVAELRLEPYTIPLISRSVHLKGARIRKADWKALEAAGDRVHLLHLAPLNGTKPSKRLADYIRSGESEAVHKGYKCSIRTPWYAVPSVWIPDGFVFRQIYNFPRLVLNRAKTTSTDTIHRLTCKAKPEQVIANTYTYMTAASAEIEGRSYGGGVLELEPTETERLLMPTKLTTALPLAECDRLIRSGHLDDVLDENSRLVLMGSMGLSRTDCMLLRKIWTKMRDRRLARSRRRRPSNAAGALQ
ncbi:MAG: Eco57I restriction-modification methylase domain-containing protein [Planctomycetota bacterium]|jgi:adenine-specific DNA methylase